MKFRNSRIAALPIAARLLILVIILLVLWLPVVGVSYWLLDDSNTISIVVMAFLFIEFVGLLQIWGRWVYQIPQPLQCYGLVASRQNARDLLKGLAIGAVSLFCLFGTEGALGWLIWRSPSWELIRIASEGLLIAVAVGFGEELIFRGWLLDELERDFQDRTSLWIDGIAFAVLHFIKPLQEMVRTFPQFPGLVLLGLTLVWAKRQSRSDASSAPRGRLGLPIGLHAGLVWGFYIINVGNMVTYSNRVPEWITGIDKNPLAGAAGLAFLGILAGGMNLLNRRS